MPIRSRKLALLLRTHPHLSLHRFSFGALLLCLILALRMLQLLCLLLLRLELLLLLVLLLLLLLLLLLVLLLQKPPDDAVVRELGRLQVAIQSVPSRQRILDMGGHYCLLSLFMMSLTHHCPKTREPLIWRVLCPGVTFSGREQGGIISTCRQALHFVADARILHCGSLGIGTCHAKRRSLGCS